MKKIFKKLGEDFLNFVVGENKKIWKDLGFEEIMVIYFLELEKVINF